MNGGFGLIVLMCVIVLLFEEMLFCGVMLCSFL